MQSPGQSKLDSLTGLRYFAALSILVGHAAYNLPASFGEYQLILERSTGLGMPLFFVLSGFLMAYNYAGQFANGIQAATLRSYAVARFARIYPVYIITMLLSFSFMGSFFHDLHQYKTETLKSLVYNVTLTQNWFHFWAFDNTPAMRRIYFAYHGISWSVSTETFFYLLFPLVALLLLPLAKRSRHAVAGAVAAVVVWALIDLVFARTYGPELLANHSSWPSWFCYRSPYGRFGEFLLGCFVGRLFLLQSDTVPSCREKYIGRGVLWLAGLGLLGCVYFLPVVNSSGFVSYLLQNIGLAPFCAAIIYCLARYSSMPQWLLGTRPLVLLGEASYCMYLIHPFVQSLFAPRSAGEGDLVGRKVVLYNTAAMFVTMHVLSLGFFQFVETPSRRWLRALLSPRPNKPVVVRKPEEAPVRAAA